MRRPWWVMLAGCAGVDPAPGADAEFAGDSDVPEVESPPTSSPSGAERPDAAALAAGLEEALDRALRVEEEPLRGVLGSVLAVDLASCTSTRAVDGGWMWEGDCAQDVTLRAVGQVIWSDGAVEPDEAVDAVVTALAASLGRDPAAAHLSSSALQVVGAANFVGSEGLLLHLWGEFSAWRVEYPGLSVGVRFADGPLEDAAALPGTWPAGAVRADLATVAELRAEDGEAAVWIDGGFGGLTGPFGAAHVVAGAWTPGCDLEPVGVWELRDGAGRWHALRFDPDVACDGCGVVSTEGAEDLPVCLDEATSRRLAARVVGP